jgi:hypothetical protein
MNSGRGSSRPDPQETFVVAVALWLDSERSGRTTRRLTENYSAITAVGRRRQIGQVSAAYLPLSLERPGTAAFSFGKYVLPTLNCLMIFASSLAAF